MDIRNYQSRPVFVQAIQVTEENLPAVAKWCRGKIISATYSDGEVVAQIIAIPDARSDECAGPGDWVVGQLQNGLACFYAVPNSIFCATYEEI